MCVTETVLNDDVSEYIRWRESHVCDALRWYCSIVLNELRILLIHWRTDSWIIIGEADHEITQTRIIYNHTVNQYNSD